MPRSTRPGTTSVRIIARPEKTAPATKYGAKIVLCHPGTIAAAKSHDTMLWTDTTRAVIRPARSAYAVRKWRHSPAVPAQPIASHRKMRARQPAEWSRTVAKSGRSSRYQNSTLTTKYVPIANASQMSDELKFTHSPRSFGYGINQ